MRRRSLDGKNIDISEALSSLASSPKAGGGAGQSLHPKRESPPTIDKLTMPSETPERIDGGEGDYNNNANSSSYTRYWPTEIDDVNQESELDAWNNYSSSSYNNKPGSSSPSQRKKDPFSSGKDSRKSSMLSRRRSFPAPDVGRATEERFLDRMERLGLHVVEVEGDGNCLFRAVSHQLYLSEDRHEELRAQCVSHMEQHRERFAPFCPINFDDHLKQMKKPGCWADDLEIRALEEITDRIICIYSSESRDHTLTPMHTNFEDKKILAGVAPIILSYHGQSHYNSVFDEKQTLPLEPRSSRVLAKARARLFAEVWESTKGIAGYK